MSTTIDAPGTTDAVVGDLPAPQNQKFTGVLRAEWIKLRSVRSTWWTVIALVGLGAGLTIVLGAANAEWLASAEADEPPESFITWGMAFAQIAALVLGALVVTGEYASGMIRTTFSAVPRRGMVLAAKSVLVTVVLFVLGTATALLGYFGANFFFEREGIGLALEGDILRSMYGNGLVLAGFGLLGVAVGFLLRHTAGTITVLVAIVLIASNMAMMIPGDIGELIMQVMPGNAVGSLSAPIPFNPTLLDAWPGFAVFVAEVAVVLAAAGIVVRRRDA